MTPEGKIVSEANKYVAPAVEDYLGARCLLLNNVFVGLTLAHEAAEKLTKALLILESIKIPRSCHKLSILTKLLVVKDDKKYKFLSDSAEFIQRLDLHYGWRYYDGDFSERSQSKSPEDLHPFDLLWVTLHKVYMDHLPQQYRFRTYFLSYLFDEKLNECTGWGNILQEKNLAIVPDLTNWQSEWGKIFVRNI